MSALEDYRAVRKDATLILGTVRKYVAAKNRADAAHRRADVLHPSEMGREGWCVRAATARILGQTSAGAQRAHSFTTLNKFQVGHDAHAKWQRWIGAAGELWGRWRCLACESVSEGFRPERCYECASAPQTLVYDELVLEALDTHLIQGRTDGCLPKQKALVEIKTIGSGTVRWEDPSMWDRCLVRSGTRIGIDLDRMRREVNRPFRSHLIQGSLYLWLARGMGIDVDQIVYIYEFKDSSDVEEFRLRYDERYIADVLAKARIVKEAVDARTLPACVTKDCRECTDARAA